MTAHYTDLIDPPNAKSVPVSVKTYDFGEEGFYAAYFKRLLDILFVLVSLPIVLPVMIVMSIVVGIDGGLPFYTQKRIGRNGRIFTMWKLRTMVPDAEDKLQGYLETNSAARREWDCTQKLKDDPRITSIGRILRKTSMDELPQLWNVLTGDMSLIGPRPMMPEQRNLYPGPVYFGTRPGITGLWQVSDRNECSFASRASFDHSYRQDLSFSADMNILQQTVFVVLRGTGY